MIKERISLPKGNDGVFSVFVYKQAQEIHGSIGQEVLRQNREALNLSEVQNLSVKAKNTFSGKMKELPYHIKNDSEHPNLLFVEFPKELQEIASFNLIIEFDIPLESLADKLLHRLVELPFVEITKSTEKAPMVEDVVFVADVVPAIIGERGERGEQGLQGIQGERGERGQDGINGTNGENGRDGRDGENGKSALELLNEENQEFISKLKELIPQRGESSDDKDALAKKVFSPFVNMPPFLKNEFLGKFSYLFDNFDYIRQAIAYAMREKGIDKQRAYSILEGINSDFIAKSFYKIEGGALYFYPMAIKMLNSSQNVLFEYINVDNPPLDAKFLPDFEIMPIFPGAGKATFLFIDSISKAYLFYEVDYSQVLNTIANFGAEKTYISCKYEYGEDKRLEDTSILLSDAAHLLENFTGEDLSTIQSSSVRSIVITGFNEIDFEAKLRELRYPNIYE